MSDDRLFFKLHNGFPEHPKTIELSDKAFRQLIEAWCYCSRNLNDGYLTKSQFLRFFSPKSRGELTAVGFIREEGNSFVMHDYLEHQMSAQQVADLRKHRQEAGAKGGKAKANRLASAKQMPEQTPSKPLPDIDIDPDVDKTPPKGGAPRKRGTRLQEDFQVTPDMRLWASQKAPHADIGIETEKFINFWVAKTGRDATKLDWVATWRNWMLNARPQQGQGRMDHSSRGLAKGMALLQAWDAQHEQQTTFELEA